MYRKMANSASLRVCHDLRQMSSALIVLKNVSTIARQAHAKHAVERGRIVIAVALTAHRYLEAMLTQKLLIIVGAILAAAIRMVKAALGRLA